MTHTRQLRRQAPRRRSRLRPAPRRRNWFRRIALAAAGLLFVLLAWAALARHFAPHSNTSLTRFDAIIVLGSGADADGNPTPTQLSRVTEAVHEYERGVAPRLIFTGAGVKNQFVEARVMAKTAHAQGIPESAIFLEPEARNTIQNACYSVRIMNDHGWRSAEVVSVASHLPRAGLIFSSFPLEWRSHAAPPLAPESPAHHTLSASVEIVKTLRYLIWARWADHCEP